MNEKYFYLDKSEYYKERLLIRTNPEKMPFPHGTNGSFNILPARILNLSYSQYLRYCRDRLGADLIGKGYKYVVPYFTDTEEVRQLIKLLNARMKFIMNEQEFPYEYKREDNGVIIRTPFNSNENNEGSSEEISST